MDAGMPTPATHLLSNHYNQTRSEYYRQLDRASKSGGDVVPFLVYSIQGFRDGLQEQFKFINRQHLEVAWENFVHESFRDKTQLSDYRRKHVVLALSRVTSPVGSGDIAMLSPRVATEYAGKTSKTITRDLNELRKMDLIVRRKEGWSANQDLVLGFLPVRAKAKAR